MSVIKNWILMVAVCAVIVEILDMLMPDGGMKKTASLICGIAVSLCIIIPGTSIFESIKSFNFNYEDSRKSIVEKQDTYSEEQMIAVTSEFKKKLIKHIEDIVLKTEGISECQANVVIEENYNSEMYGSIYSIYIKAKEAQNEEGEKTKESGFSNFNRIEKIEIDIGGIRIIEREKPKEQKENEKENILRGLVAREFQIEEKNVFAEVTNEETYNE